jgi:hypothetical protein
MVHHRYQGHHWSHIFCDYIDHVINTCQHWRQCQIACTLILTFGKTIYKYKLLSNSVKTNKEHIFLNIFRTSNCGYPHEFRIKMALIGYLWLHKMATAFQVVTQNGHCISGGDTSATAFQVIPHKNHCMSGGYTK